TCRDFPRWVGQQRGHDCLDSRQLIVQSHLQVVESAALEQKEALRHGDAPAYMMLEAASTTAAPPGDPRMLYT
ncbi:unnamed protein product, partial [Mycena citricolor]